MAINAAKQLLDELMGRERDLAPNEKRCTISWDDPTVCKHNLVKFCPNSLFINTKADIGPCYLVHDDYLKREYESKASRREKRQYEDDFIRFCQAQLNDVDKKIKRAKKRLEMSKLEKNNLSNNSYILSEENQERIQKITEKIEKLLEEIQQLGCEGKVEEAQTAMKEVDQLKEERAQIKRENQSCHWIQQKAEIGAAQEKQMEVCDVCGAFLIVNDVQQRIDDHLMGKQHVGFGRLKTALDEILEQRKRRKEEGYEESNNNNDNSAERNLKYRDAHDRRYRERDLSSSSLHTRSSHRDHRDRDHRSDRRSDLSRRSERDNYHHRSSHHHHHQHRHRSRSRSRSSEKSSSYHHRSSRIGEERRASSSNNGTTAK